jgi:type II secretory ATPase GspE/PulE/Tfp pilus assembly ATPase PilB-like protein
MSTHARNTPDLPESAADNGTPDAGRVETTPAAAHAGGSLRDRCGLLGIPWQSETPKVDTEAIQLVTAEVAARLRLVPLRRERTKLVVGMIDPLDIAAVDEIAAMTGRAVSRVGVDQDVLSELMRTYYGTTAARMAESLAGDAAETADDVEHNPIQTRASDVHVEPFENELKVKYRIDGILAEQPPPPKHLQPALIGRIKIMSGMNIAERYVPQDGHITLRFEGRKVDIRVSTVPTLYGESVVMRILDKSTLPLDLESLGMGSHLRDAIDKLIAKPHGLVLVTGPTGSGKTTTLYAALSRLYSPTKKIITIEDPVEYELGGINQMPVNPKRGLTFATGLRHILRQDPDVIFVGEIRDNETADIAIRSALTGHLIFSTLHTNDSISSISRLIDMGAEPYLVASVIEGVLAQRLGRRVCQHCRSQVPLPEDVEHRLSPRELAMFDGQVWRGTGCPKCNDSGLQGRIGFFELLHISPSVRRAISENRSTAELIDIIGSSLVNMRADGLEKAVAGLTTIEEVMRATQDAEELGV